MGMVSALTAIYTYQPSKVFFSPKMEKVFYIITDRLSRNPDLRAEQNKLRLLKAPAIITKVAARPKLQKNNTIKLRTFVVGCEGDFDIPFITYRYASQEERPPRGLKLPCKTRLDIHDLEESLSQEQILQELVSNSFFFIPSTRLHGSPESPP